MSMTSDPYSPDPKRYDGRMPYRRCGRWGIQLPAITLGCWHNFGGDIVTENQREGGNHLAGEQVQVGAAHASGSDPHDHLEWSLGVRCRQLFEDE